MIKSQQTIFFVTQVVSGINDPAKRSEFFFMVQVLFPLPLCYLDNLDVFVYQWPEGQGFQCQDMKEQTKSQFSRNCSLFRKTIFLNLFQNSLLTQMIYFLMPYSKAQLNSQLLFLTLPSLLCRYFEEIISEKLVQM